MNKPVKLVLFDAANTLIHKPLLWERISNVLTANHINVDTEVLKRHHKFISEVIFFPDRTSADFYKNFNRELLYSLGIIPTDQLLDDIFNACTYLPWEPFEDTAMIRDLPFPKAIISNFNGSLAEKIDSMFHGVFSRIIISEELKQAKPSLSFYNSAIELLGVPPENILYIGDSVKLDMEPGLKTGMQSYLIDRHNCYPYYKNRLTTLSDLAEIIN